MKVTLWGTRGSLASPGANMARYGGNTSCVQVTGDDGSVLILDAGTGIRQLGLALPRLPARIDLFLSHLHLDHVQGLGFFTPLFDPDREVHIWGPGSTTQTLQTRLNRYLSPPLFPIHLRELPCKLTIDEAPLSPQPVGRFVVQGALVCHPGPTLGYRIEYGGSVLAYLPDHEPALGWRAFPAAGDWVSGFSLAREADLLIHDAQYTDAEYRRKTGWGHSSVEQAIQFAELAGARRLLAFHHDPARTDDALDAMVAKSVRSLRPGFPVSPAAEGDTLTLLTGPE